MVHDLKLQRFYLDTYDSSVIDRTLSRDVKPFILSYNIEAWVAFSLWTPAFFKEKYGDQAFYIHPDLPSKTAPYLHSVDSQTSMMKLADLIDLMLTANKGYLTESPINLLKDLENDYDFSDLIPVSEKKKKSWASLWIGANTHSGLHFDLLDNFFVQVDGIKKFVLIPPEDIRLTYPIPSYFSKSPINPFEPDLKKYPKFNKARLLQGELKKGDVLFIPKGWHHYFYAPKYSISLNCFYGRPLTPQNLLPMLFKAGWKPCAAMAKDFLWNGVLGRSFEYKLYCSAPFGKVIYDHMVFYIKNRFSKHTPKSELHSEESL
jgi:lysine-specific demethylase 8